MTWHWIRLTLSLGFLLLPAGAQAQAPAAGTIQGQVTFSHNGSPASGITVYLNVPRPPGDNGLPTTISAVTDALGQYSLTSVPWGTYRVSVKQAEGIRGRSATVSPSLPEARVNLTSDAPGSISGRILDENRKPVAGADVWLMLPGYEQGVPMLAQVRGAKTNADGDYRFRPVPPGIGYLILAARWEPFKNPSDAAATPEERAPVPVQAFYPGAPDPAGATPVQLRSGEDRTQVDLRLRTAAAYCIAGEIRVPAGQKPAYLEIRETASGYSATVGFSAGDYRICGIPPGAYSIAAKTAQQAAARPIVLLASRNIVVAGKDLADVNLTPEPPIPVSGKITWTTDSGEPRLSPNRVVVSFAPISQRKTEENLSYARAEGVMTPVNLFPGEYAASVTVNQPGIYVKDLTYAGRSVWNQPISIAAGQNPGFGLVLSLGAATLIAQAQDGDGRPVPECQVVAVPDSANSETAVAAGMRVATSGSDGKATFAGLPPGKYRVIAGGQAVNASRESAAWVLSNRFNGKEIELAPGARTSVTVKEQ